MESEVESTSARLPKIIFPALFDAFDRLINHMELRHFAILIDEWSSIPIDLQPHLAELLNRIFFPNRKVVIKITSLEFRSRFAQYDSNGRREYGLELGGDLETAIDLDDFYVYDRDPVRIKDLYGEFLWRHLNAALEGAHLETEYGVESSANLVDLFFTEQAFEEIARAAEGVARDLLQVFSRSYTKAWRAEAAHITVPAVTNAARDWYESDKQSNLTEQQHGLLRALVEEVISTHHARSFMVTREDSNTPLLRSLIDQRVLHIIRKGYADKDNPAIRYNIYTLDYGCYVDLKATKGEPGFEVAPNGDSGEPFVVPFDDNRKIRRIIVPRHLLTPETATS